MFKSVLVLGHIRGIRIELHVSWVIIVALLLVTMSLGFRQQYPEWSLTVTLTTALLTAMAFFASIVAHELGHSLVAIRRGIPVKSITLFIFGGMAQMGRDTERANDEFWIAIAGPLVSLALAVLFGLLMILTANWHEPLTVALGWLSIINLVVAVFNMVPGFPLDGGRVFRALVWKYTGDARKGITAAVTGGRLVAYGLFGVALLNILWIGNLIGGLWIMLIAWFLLHMAEGQGRMFDLRERLSGVRARDVADADIPMVPATSSIHTWIHQHVLPDGRRAYLVGAPDRALGLITLSDTRKVPQEHWPDTRVTEIMTPVETLTCVHPDTNVNEILRLITERNLNQIPVMENGRVSGWIDRPRLLRTIDIHMEVKR